MKISRRELLRGLLAIGTGLSTLPVVTTRRIEATGLNYNSGGRTNFPIRGLKGWAWSAAQYLEEIPHLRPMNLNFLMNCYTNTWDTEHYYWGQNQVNRWWEELPKIKKDKFKQVVRRCQTYHIEFCFSMNPGLSSERSPNADSKKDLDDLFQHFVWMQSLGVSWFSLSMDDQKDGDALNHSRLANLLLERLRKRDEQVQLIFGPQRGWYGNGRGQHQDYLYTLKQHLDPEVYIFWTGDQIISPKISIRTAESYQESVGHRLFIWDNYPCNDGSPTMHLGPLTGRDYELCQVADGYMSNAMYLQNRLNRLPLWTCADYAYDPYHYDPERSLRMAINQLATTPDQRQTLADLAGYYRSNLPAGKDQFYNPVREDLVQELRDGNMPLDMAWYIEVIERLAFRLTSDFHQYFGPEYDTIMADAEWIWTLIYQPEKLELNKK